MPLQTNLANGASTNNVNHGAMGGVDWTTFTVGGWWLPTTVTVADRNMWSKGVNGGARLNCRQSSATLGSIRVGWARATTGLAYVTSGGYILANHPVCVFVTGDQNGAANELVNIYTSDGTGPLTEVGYASRNDGSGAFSSIAAQPFRMNASEVPDAAFSGMAFCTWVFENRILTLDQMNDLMLNYETGRTMQPDLMCRYGANGTGRVIDESGNGNHGTITGATPTNAYLPRVFSLTKHRRNPQ